MLNLVGVGTIFRRAISVAIDAITEAVNAFYTTYIARVTTDSGSVRSETNTKTIYRWFVENDLVSYIKFLWFAEAGIKIANPTDTLKRISKGYSLDQNATPNDFTQTVEANQIYLSGDIAPTEVYAGKNVAGASRFGEFNDLTFTNGDPWTVTFVGNWDGSNNADAGLIGKGNDSAGLISLRDNSTNRFRFINDSGDSVAGTLPINHIIGANTIISFVAAGDGSLRIYMDGALFETLTVATGVTFSQFLKAFSTASREFFGRCHYVEIMHYSLTSLITSYHAMLRARFARFETVQIGDQHWVTSSFDGACGANGTLIPNVTDAGAWVALSTPAWCYYNNDPATGAIYGKLYNWYAVKQLQDDIDVWNAANPSNRFGYHVPTQAEKDLLITNGGGTSVAGKAFKVDGSVYWLTEGGTNSSGLTMLGSGSRIPSTGVYANLRSRIFMWTSTEKFETSSYMMGIKDDEDNIYSGTVSDKRTGCIIRLLKD